MKLLNSEIEKRVGIKLDRSINTKGTSGIMTFGYANDYPQVIEKLILNSQTARSCANIYARFIAGSGFTNPEIGSVVVGYDERGKKITLDKMRGIIATSLAMFNGAFIHCNENLNKEVGNTRLIQFKNCRFSAIDDAGYCGKVAVHPNWSKDVDLKKFNSSDVSWYFNFNLDSIESNVKATGGFDADGNFKGFKGQVYFLSFDDQYIYPLSPFDSVYLDMDTEYQIQLFKNREIRDGFSDKIVMSIDPPDDETERRKTIKECQDWMGPDGKKLLIFESEFDESGNLKKDASFNVQEIKTNINDKLFENWEKSLANNIRKAIYIPAVLIDYEQGQLSQASGEMLTQAIGYYNGLTNILRQQLSEAIGEIYSNHVNPILKNNTDWSIKPFELT